MIDRRAMVAAAPSGFAVLALAALQARPALAALALAAARCLTGRARADAGHWVAVGDPMEAALDASVESLVELNFTIVGHFSTDGLVPALR